MFPPESDRKASIPGEYRAESVKIINRIRPLSYQLLGRAEAGPTILLTWTRRGFPIKRSSGVERGPRGQDGGYKPLHLGPNLVWGDPGR